MNKRLFKPGDIVVCIDPAGNMYECDRVDQLIFGKTYKINSYKDTKPTFYNNVYLEKWNGFSGNCKQNQEHCTFLQKRFILKSSLTDKELIFLKVKYKFGFKYENSIG